LSQAERSEQAEERRYWRDGQAPDNSLASFCVCSFVALNSSMRGSWQDRLRKEFLTKVLSQ
jgi:hypothetical protein